MSDTYAGCVILCDRCNTRLWIKEIQGTYKPIIVVDGHDCKNIFVKKQVTQFKKDVRECMKDRPMTFKTPVKGEN
jgi:hypothetical protein